MSDKFLDEKLRVDVKRDIGKDMMGEIMLGVFIIIICIFSLPFVAHAVHKGAGALTCGNCHTMHNSQGNAAMEGASGGSVILLRGSVSSRAEIHKLCLQCHASNGSMASVSFAPQNVVAPKVYSSATWTDNDPFNLIGAGGNFSGELDSSWNATDATSLGRGHSMGLASADPPGKLSGDSAITDFTCTNCHDPHGTDDPADTKVNIFRNLKVKALGSGQDGETGTVMLPFVNDPTKPYREHLSYVGGVNGSYFGGSETDSGGNVIWPVYKGTLDGDPNGADSGKSNSYGTGSEYKPNVVTMSRWCAQCHDNWHEDIETNNLYRVEDMDTRRHAVNSVVPRGATADCANGCHVSMLDRANYTTGVITAGKGLPVTASAYYTGTVYYLPYTAPCSGSTSCMDNAYGGVQGDNHKVFCLSCHFAHGGPYYDALRWDYLSAVSSGTETGNGIASNKGCQLCHNR